MLNMVKSQSNRVKRKIKSCKFYTDFTLAEYRIKIYSL